MVEFSRSLILVIIVALIVVFHGTIIERFDRLDAKLSSTSCVCK